MAKKIKRQLGESSKLNCACVIHDNKYDWQYVEKLYNGLKRNLSPEIVFHVYTESDRAVPPHLVKHSLEEWPGLRGPKKSWWYKIQLFNSQQFSGNLLYLDLDTVITGNIDWIWNLTAQRLNARRDFRHLFRSNCSTINSSVMWFNTEKFSYVYDQFDHSKVSARQSRWQGDQDYISDTVPISDINFLPENKILSYKWQVREGGWNFKTRKSLNPGSPTLIQKDTSVLIFHGKPDPCDCADPVIRQYWT